MEWFKDTYLKNWHGKLKVLDVGSFCVGKSLTYRLFFNSNMFEYVGLDMRSGPNVDIVVKVPYKWQEIPDNFCDVLISGQAFEHIEFPWLTISEIARVLKPNGLSCIIAPNSWYQHRYPVDCWRFFEDGFIALAKWAGLEILHVSVNLAPKGAPIAWYDNLNKDCIMVLRKPKKWNSNTIDILNYSCVPSNLNKFARPLIPYEQQPYYKKIIKGDYPKIKLNNQRKKIYIWGKGEDSKNVVYQCKKNNWDIAAFLDSSEKAGAIYPQKILKQKSKDYFIVISSRRYCFEIAEICKEAGLKKDIDFWVPI
jgi:SAM-dependent methyltransferase